MTVNAVAPYAWPAFAPHQTPKLVYLDLMHWIGLAQAAVGHSAGRRHAPILEACRTARSAGIAIFPLSATHYLEMSRIQDPRQRLDLAEVMEELSGFVTLAGRPLLMRMEIDAALAATGYPGRDPAEPPRLLGFGVGWSFAHEIVPHLVDPDGRDVTAEARQAHPGGPEEFDRWWANMRLSVERSMLRGPTDVELPDLRAHGYRPENVDEIAERRAQRERDLTVELSREPRWRRGRLRDVIAAREHVHELSNALGEALLDRQITFDNLGWGRDSARRFTDLMPGTDVAVTLKTAGHRNPNKSWETNDIHDVDALAVAVPYCDVVVTEKHAHHVLTGARIGERAGTEIFRRLSELDDWLRAQFETVQQRST